MKHQILTEFMSILQFYIHETSLRVAKQGIYSYDFSIFWSNFVIIQKNSTPEPWYTIQQN
jgi:hypothetical protein